MTEFQCTQCRMQRSAKLSERRRYGRGRRKREDQEDAAAHQKDAPKERDSASEAATRPCVKSPGRLQEMNCLKMLRMSCLRTVKVRRAVAAAEAEDAAASRMAKTVPRNRIPAKNEEKSETAWFRSFFAQIQPLPSLQAQ
ncbi:MAG: hypothetical protein ACLRVN_00780 [Butyricicoccus sp.]